MGWEKGKKRGPSQLAGSRTLDLDPRVVAGILDDNTEPPEVRFVAVMDLLLDALAASNNKNAAVIGYRLRTFWANDMEKTVIWTPIGGESDIDARLAAPPGGDDSAL